MDFRGMFLGEQWVSLYADVGHQ